MEAVGCLSNVPKDTGRIESDVEPTLREVIIDVSNAAAFKSVVGGLSVTGESCG